MNRFSGSQGLGNFRAGGRVCLGQGEPLSPPESLDHQAYAPETEPWSPAVGLRGIDTGRDRDESATASRLEHPGEAFVGFAVSGSPVDLACPLDLRALLTRHRLIPSARLSSVDDAVLLAEALNRVGLPVLEVSLATDSALPAIEAIRTALPDFHVGAGTVLTSRQINEARAAGARFGAGPAMSPGLLASALSAEFPFLPGAMTPSEIECGMQWGFWVQGFCPAVTAGGPAMVRAVVESYRHTPLLLVPGGGVRMADFHEYLVIPEVAAVSGRFLCDSALIDAGMWEDIEAQAVLCMRKAVAAVRARLVAS
jgi:2-dehydro-3-deoxyphosphogluconate aldolase/(4S)-4-hydroxy-2-oxoglutarate aldolase